MNILKRFIPKQRDKYTFLGFIATLLWATMPLFAKLIGDLPYFQFISVAFFISFLFYLLINIKNKNLITEVKSIPLTYIILGVFGIFGNHSLLFISLNNGNTSLNLLIYSTWPFLILFLSAIILKTNIYPNYIIGTLICILGIAFSNFNEIIFNTNSDILYGMILAFLGGFVWALYSVILSKYNNISSSAIMIVMLFSSILSLVSHFIFENNSVAFSLNQFILITLLAFGPMGIGFILWNKGMQYGDIATISNLSYIKPLLALILLILFSFVEYNVHIILGFFMIILGAFITTIINNKPSIIYKTSIYNKY